MFISSGYFDIMSSYHSCPFTILVCPLSIKLLNCFQLVLTCLFFLASSSSSPFYLVVRFLSQRTLAEMLDVRLIRSWLGYLCVLRRIHLYHYYRRKSIFLCCLYLQLDLIKSFSIIYMFDVFKSVTIDQPIMVTIGIILY